MRPNEFLVYFLITDAVGDVIHSCPQHTLGVFQQNDVRRGAESMLVRFINCSLINLGTHFLACAQEIIDTHFYDVGFVTNQFVNAFSRFFGSLDGDSTRDDRGVLYQSGNIQARRRPRRGVPALFPQGKFFVATKAEDRGNTVAQIEAELSRIVDVSVRADQSGNNSFS